MKTFSLQKRIILTTSLCNGLEVYDFFLWGILAPHITKLFFPPNTDPLFSLMLSLLAFSLSYMVKPFGALFWGYIGDLYGRKQALFWTILGMGTATPLIGMVPLYADVGIVSPLMVVMLRILQGFCAGGEGTGSIVYTLEHFKGARSGFWGSILYFSHNLGFFMALLVTYLVSLNTDIVASSAWRWCFIAGALLGVVGFYLRRSLDESPYFSKNLEARKTSPLIATLTEHRYDFFKLFLLYGVVSAASVSMSVFANGYLTEILGMEISSAKSFLLATSVICLATLPLGGYLCDKMGAEKVILPCLIFIVVFALPFHMLLANGTTLSIMTALASYAIPVCLITGSLPHYVSTSFPARNRYTGAGFSDTIAGAVLGAHQPLFAMYLIKRTGYPWTGGIYVMLLAAAFLVFYATYRLRFKQYAYNE